MDGKKPQADSVFALIGSRVAIDRLPRIEKQWYLHWKAILEKDLQSAYETILTVTEIDPKQFISNLEAGIMADGINRPAEAVRIFGLIKPEHAPSEFEAYTWWHSHYAHNLYRLGQYDQAFAILEFVPPRLRQAQNYYNRLAEIYIAQTNTKALEQMMDGLLASNVPGEEKIKTFLFIAENYGARQQPVLQKKWAERAMAWCEKTASDYTPPSYLKGAFPYLAGQYQKALPMLHQATREKGLDWLQMTKEGPGWV